MHEGEILRFDQNDKSGGGMAEEREDSEIPRLRFAALGMTCGGGRGWEAGDHKGRPYGGTNIVGHGDHPHPNLPPYRGGRERGGGGWVPASARQRHGNF